LAAQPDTSKREEAIAETCMRCGEYFTKSQSMSRRQTVLFRRWPFGFACAAGGVAVDLGLDRGAGLPEEILVVLHGEIVAGAQ
jgi:hypothetical protein